MKWNLLMLLATMSLATEEQAWTRHIIETGLLGADGVKLIDVNNDKRLDAVTGWEQSGIAAIYLHPDNTQVRSPWPKKHLSGNASIEDAVCADLMGDGRMALITSCEGNNQTLSIQWPPLAGDPYIVGAVWQRTIIATKERWMYAEALQIDGRHGLDIIAGSKGKGASITWFAAPATDPQTNKWVAHKLADATWIMSIFAIDMDGDNDLDILFSDREGPQRGVRWLENPGAVNVENKWPAHRVYAPEQEILFIDVGDLDGDGDLDIAGATKKAIILLQRNDTTGTKWTASEIPLPTNVGTGKSIAIGDINGDNKLDLVLACESAEAPRSGIVWLSATGAAFTDPWQRHEISGPDGIKFDHSRLVDLDDDGDLDVINSEENNNSKGGNGGFGLIWYENNYIK